MKGLGDCVRGVGQFLGCLNSVLDVRMPCPYANALGIPGQGVHSKRIFGLALFDILATMVLALVTAYFLQISFLKSFISWFIIGEVLHYMFGTPTAFLAMIGMTPKC